MRAAVLVAALLAVTPRAQAADAGALREAKEHFDRGMAHYELGEFGAAIEEFKQSYARSQAPGLLFNLAQASRLNKDYEQALHFYRTYLRVRPEAANRDDVERRIAELEPIVEAQRREELAAANRARSAAQAPEPSSPVPSTPPSGAVEPSPATVRPASASVRARPGGRGERIGGIVVGALGLAALGAGIGVGVAALDAQSRLSKLAADMGSWTPSQADLYRSGQRDAAAATALYVVGGVAVATGVVLYVVGWRKDRARFAVAPTARGGQAVWSCAF